MRQRREGGGSIGVGSSDLSYVSARPSKSFLIIGANDVD